MPDSDECIDDHEEHGFDGFMIGVDGSCKLDDDLITVGGNEDSKKVAEPHASNQQGMIDGVFNHFVLIFENPAVNLAKIIVNDMFKTLNDYSIVYVSVCASINVSEWFCGGVNYEVQQIAFLLNWNVGHVGCELLNPLNHIRFKIWETSADYSKQVQRCWSPCLNVVVFEVVIKESFRFIVEQIQYVLVDTQVWHHQFLQQLTQVFNEKWLHLLP